MISRALSFILTWLFLLVACNKESPMQPEQVKTPELIPFALGANWEYRYSYHYHEYYDYVEPIINVDENLTGKYIVSVDSCTAYLDSVIYIINTTTIPDTGINSVVEKWEIMLRSDKLCYKLDGVWKYMSSAIFESGSGIDIRVFLPAIGRRYDLVKGTLVPGGYKIASINYSYDNAGNGLLVEITGEGVDKIEISWSSGSYYMHPQWMIKRVWLDKYTPGNS